MIRDLQLVLFQAKRFRIPGYINEKHITFRQRKKMREFLGYAGYFRASRYGKFLLTQVNAFGSKTDSKVFFELYDFDVQLRLLLFKYHL